MWDTPCRSLRIASERDEAYVHQLDHDADNDRFSMRDAAWRTARKDADAARHTLTH